MIKIFIFLLLLIGMQNPKSILEAFTNLFLFVILSFYVLSKKLSFFQPLGILFIIIILFNVASYGKYIKIKVYLQEPVPESYFDDKIGYLRIYYLVEKGENYYQAFAKSHKEDARGDSIPKDIFSWRLPTYVYLWKIFPGSGGESIYILFLITVSINLYLVYKISSFFISEKLALLSPYLLLPYFLYASTSIEFLQTDWWALTPFFIGILFLLKKKIPYSTLFFTIALTIRELFLIPYFGLILLNFVTRQYRKFFFMLLPIIFLFFVIYLHWKQAAQFTSIHLSTREHGFDFRFLNQSLAYSSINYLFFKLRPFLVLIMVSVIFFFLNIRKENIYNKLALILIFIVPILVYSKVGSTPYTDYWGITFVPFALAFAPVFLLSREARSYKIRDDIYKYLPLSPSRFVGTVLIEKALKKYLINNDQILDVGYGKFYLLHILKKLNMKLEYTGLDISSYKTGKLRNLRITTHEIDITKFKSPKKYDLITCLWVLEHIKDDKMALKSINRLLKSSGIFILSVPSIWSWPFEFGRHGYHYYTKKKLREKIQKAGFKVINFYSLGGMLGWLFMVLYSWPRYIFLILLLPSYILLSKIGFIKQNWKKFSSTAVSKTFYRYHKNESAVLAHNTVISNLSRIDSFAKLFPSSYLLVAKKK